MARAPLPQTFPGEFFVLTWDRDRESFVLYVDDESESSYDLGHEPMQVVNDLQLRGFNKHFRETAVDYAREFGMAQCIPSEGRVVQILPRDAAKAPRLQFPDEERQHHDWLPSLY